MILYVINSTIRMVLARKSFVWFFPVLVLLISLVGFLLTSLVSEATIVRLIHMTTGLLASFLFLFVMISTSKVFSSFRDARMKNEPFVLSSVGFGYFRYFFMKLVAVLIFNTLLIIPCLFLFPDVLFPRSILLVLPYTALTVLLSLTRSIMRYLVLVLVPVSFFLTIYIVPNPYVMLMDARPIVVLMYLFIYTLLYVMLAYYISRKVWLKACR